MKTLTEKGINEIKETYPKGTRILLVEMGEDPRPVPSNCWGTVEVVDDIGTIHVAFDNGRRLGLIFGVDSFIKQKTLVCCFNTQTEEFLSNSVCEIQKSMKASQFNDELTYEKIYNMLCDILYEGGKEAVTKYVNKCARRRTFL